MCVKPISYGQELRSGVNETRVGNTRLDVLELRILRQPEHQKLTTEKEGIW
jgi:hypothetical protein